MRVGRGLVLLSVCLYLPLQASSFRFIFDYCIYLVKFTFELIVSKVFLLFQSIWLSAYFSQSPIMKALLDSFSARFAFSLNQLQPSLTVRRTFWVLTSKFRSHHLSTWATSGREPPAPTFLTDTQYVTSFVTHIWYDGGTQLQADAIFFRTHGELRV